MSGPTLVSGPLSVWVFKSGSKRASSVQLCLRAMPYFRQKKKKNKTPPPCKFQFGLG